MHAPMNEHTRNRQVARPESIEPPKYFIIAVCLFCIVILFSNLGGAALFEPDEGRNAEIAREILLLDDWVTPHYDSIPRLDKPMLFFGLVAFSFKFFGLSEWSARLPSVVAALGCLSLVYLLARYLAGRWAAFWSVLILVTSIEFFALSRIVILDMMLTLFITLSLACFWLGQRVAGRSKKAVFLIMYAAIAVATLIKGPIGFIIPGAVIFSYVVLSKNWPSLREMELPLGLPVFLLIAASWYVAAEVRNPGYLQHFLLEENVARFATSQFKRGGPWFYFIVVFAVGFFPWTALLPLTVRELRKRSLSDERLFLLLWIALPLITFSFSASKLPHYILPVYPPVAILLGTTIAKLLTDPAARKSCVLSLPAAIFLLSAAVAALVVLWPSFLPYRIQQYVDFDLAPSLLGAGLVFVGLFGLVALKDSLWRRQANLYTATAMGFALFILIAQPIVASVSLKRSSKELAEKAAVVIDEGDQLVLYEKYLSSLPFYLNIQRPIWVVWSGDKNKVLGSDYVAKKRPEPAAGYGKVLYTHEEFANLSSASGNPLVIFIDEPASKALPRMKEGPKRLLQLGATSVLTNRRISSPGAIRPTGRSVPDQNSSSKAGFRHKRISW